MGTAKGSLEVKFGRKSVTDRDNAAAGCSECLMRRGRYEYDTSGKQSADAMTGLGGGGGGGSRLSLADGLLNNTLLPVMRRPGGASNRWLRLFINLFPSRSELGDSSRLPAEERTAGKFQ